MNNNNNMNMAGNAAKFAMNNPNMVNSAMNHSVDNSMNNSMANSVMNSVNE